MDAAPTLVLLPGLACDAALFEPQHRAIARHLGRSSRAAVRVLVGDVHTRADSLPAMAELLLAEVPGPLWLAGCSMGGMVAMEVARQAPERLRGLALLGTSARADSAAMVFLRREAIRLFEAGRMHEVLRNNLPAAFHPRHATDAALVDAYLAMVQRAGADQLIGQNRAVMQRADLRPHLGAVACPTLVLVGQADALTPPDCSQEIADAIPQAQLVVLPGCGHMLTLEAPEIVTQHLLDWIDRL